jgi:hypothetical protein
LILEQTRHLAAALLARESLDDSGRVRLAYERAFSRPPSPAEVERAVAFVRQCERTLASEPGEKKDSRLRAWQSLCRVILAANEFIFVE